MVQTFLKNIIKYWDNPESCYKQKNKKIDIDYEYNFVLILKQNKNVE